MNSFFNRLKDFFKTEVRKIHDAAVSAVHTIAQSAKKTRQRLTAAAANIRQSAANRLRSLKSAFKRQEEQHCESDSAEASQKPNSADSAENAAKTETAGSPESRCKSRGQRFCAGMRICAVHAADFLAGLLFLSAVIIALKPQLLEKSACIKRGGELLPAISSIGDIKSGIGKTTERIGDMLIQIQVKVKPDISGKLKTARNIFVALFLALYVALKIVVVLLARSQTSQKIVAVLMIALTMLACTLLSEHFFIFAAVCLIASFAFAFSCGFLARTIFTKFAVFVIVALCCYVEAYILADYCGCRKSLRGIGDALSLFGENAAKFFKALRL